MHHFTLREKPCKFTQVIKAQLNIKFFNKISFILVKLRDTVPKTVV